MNKYHRLCLNFDNNDVHKLWYYVYNYTIKIIIQNIMCKINDNTSLMGWHITFDENKLFIISFDQLCDMKIMMIYLNHDHIIMWMMMYTYWLHNVNDVVN